MSNRLESAKAWLKRVKKSLYLSPRKGCPGPKSYRCKASSYTSAAFMVYIWR